MRGRGKRLLPSLLSLLLEPAVWHSETSEGPSSFGNVIFRRLLHGPGIALASFRSVFPEFRAALGHEGKCLRLVLFKSAGRGGMEFRVEGPVQLCTRLFGFTKLDEGFSQVQVIGAVIRGNLGRNAQQV